MTAARYSPRKKPSQERSRFLVEQILEAAARVFRSDGWNATTNRIAERAGISVGSLYAYFPNKEALLVALAERHVQVAEEGLMKACHDEALIADPSVRPLLAAIQTAIIDSQRFPSHALNLVSQVPITGPELQQRSRLLRESVVQALSAFAAARQKSDPELRGRIALGMVGEQTARAMFESPELLDTLSSRLLDRAVREMEDDV